VLYLEYPPRAHLRRDSGRARDDLPPPGRHTGRLPAVRTT